MSGSFWTDVMDTNNEGAITGLNNLFGVIATLMTGSTPDSLYRSGMLKINEQACQLVLHQQRSDLLTEVWQRRDFYYWFYNHIAKQGYEVRWPLAAWIVAGNLYYVAYTDYLFDVGARITGASTNQVQAMVRIGNQIIFDDVLPKLKTLVDGPVLKGADALGWDAQTLSEEQELVQAMYNQATAEELSTLEDAAKMDWKTKLGTFLTDAGKVPLGVYHKAGDVPRFNETWQFHNADHRWQYGMELGEFFKPLNLHNITRPPVSSEYTSGNKYTALNVRAKLHLLDTHLDDNIPNASALRDILNMLTPSERLELFSDLNRRDQLIEHLGGSLRMWLFAQRVDLTVQLEWIHLSIERERLATIANSLRYEQIQPMVQAATQKQRNKLNAPHWKRFFVALCAEPSIMQRALQDLKFDAATSSEWLNAVGN